MRWILALALVPLALAGQYTLYTCVVTSKGYVVGAKLAPSGIFLRHAGGEWQHAGYNHPFISALDYDRADPRTLYIAAGNGLIRATASGSQWKILTGSDVTGLMDVALDPHSPGTVYFTHTAGIRATHDGGETWHEISTGLRRKFTHAIRVDSRQSGLLVAGNEQGIFRSDDDGKSWKLSGAAGYQVTRVEQSPHNTCYWLAATEGGGLFASTDCAVTFESAGNLGVGGNLSDIAFDPLAPEHIAVAGWGVGVVLSEDRGKTWQARNAGLPSTQVWSVAFDPAHPGRIYAGVHEEALYVSEDYGRTWRRDGLEGSRVFQLRFVPEAAQ